MYQSRPGIISWFSTQHFDVIMPDLDCYNKEAYG